MEYVKTITIRGRQINKIQIDFFSLMPRLETIRISSFKGPVDTIPFDRVKSLRNLKLFLIQDGDIIYLTREWLNRPKIELACR